VNAAAPASSAPLKAAACAAPHDLDREGVRREIRQPLRRGGVFAGGQYGLYEYKKYTDIRLVFAPKIA